MATVTLTPQRWNPHPWLWLPLVLAVAVTGLLMFKTMHSYFRHRTRGEQAYNCFTHHGPSLVWQAPNEKKEMAYHFICQDQMGELFDIVMGKDGSPRSAYKLDATTLQEARNYLFRKWGGAHVPWERIPQALMEAIKPYLPVGFAGL